MGTGALKLKGALWEEALQTLEPPTNETSKSKPVPMEQAPSKQCKRTKDKIKESVWPKVRAHTPKSGPSQEPVKVPDLMLLPLLFSERELNQEPPPGQLLASVETEQWFSVPQHLPPAHWPTVPYLMSLWYLAK